MIFDENYTVPKMVKNSAEEFSEVNAQMKRIKNGQFEPVLYRELYQLGLDFGAALLSLGIQVDNPPKIAGRYTKKCLNGGSGFSEPPSRHFV